ncbi:MAG: peptide chain release factor-like protein [Nannocystaceae bacterium]
MNAAPLTLTISAGRGARAARRFTAQLAAVVYERCAAVGGRVVQLSRVGEREAPARVVLQVDGCPALAELVGTHLLLGAGRRGGRRRWFAIVERCVSPSLTPAALDRGALERRFVRAGGPGGQHVNKRATAVIVTHRPTGLRVRCDGRRSQAQNQAEALRALARAVAEHRQRPESLHRVRAWQARRDVTTHAPVMRWRVHPGRSDAIVPITE